MKLSRARRRRRDSAAARITQPSLADHFNGRRPRFRIVIDGAKAEGPALFGDVLVGLAARNGWAGVVDNGAAGTGLRSTKCIRRQALGTVPRPAHIGGDHAQPRRTSCSGMPLRQPRRTRRPVNSTMKESRALIRTSWRTRASANIRFLSTVLGVGGCGGSRIGTLSPRHSERMMRVYVPSAACPRAPCALPAPHLA